MGMDGDGPSPRAGEREPLAKRVYDLGYTGSHAAARRLIQQGRVSVNGTMTVDVGAMVGRGDTVSVFTKHTRGRHA